MMARTLHDIFEDDYKRGPFKMHLWSTYWEMQWRREIDFYEKMRWKIIAISKGTKRPVAETLWATEPGLSRNRMIDYTAQGFNLAVVAGPSDLAILDYDSKELPATLQELSTKTLTISTPRGYAFFTTEPYSQTKFKAIAERYPYFDRPRVNILYELLPLSKTCTQDFGRGEKQHECQAHDYRIREWIPGPRTILPFREFAAIIFGAG